MMRKELEPFISEFLSYDAETGVVSWKKNTKTRARSGDVAGYIQSTGYRQVKIRGVSILAHHIAWWFSHGAWPTLDIDHINGDRTDNRIANLRASTRSQNLMNQARKKDSISGRRGVRPSGSGWVAEIAVKGKRIYLGYSRNLEDAILRREAAEKRYFGEFAPAR